LVTEKICKLYFILSSLIYINPAFVISKQEKVKGIYIYNVGRFDRNVQTFVTDKWSGRKRYVSLRKVSVINISRIGVQ
jgi:hypothetical protein